MKEGTLVEEELNEKLGLIFKVSDDDGSGGSINGGTDSGSGSSADNGRTRDVGSGSDCRKSSEGIKSESVNTAGFNGHSPVHRKADCAVHSANGTVRSID
ncbi:unnamed protein product [Lasius platythorax]|uniref:Uncharacterized protein n=1 Tax=Lasius platythorax TaxID=488582 RepID=A0AAV2MZ18_9HYME